MIRVGVDAWNLPGDHRGIGRYLRSILRVWRERFADRVAPTLIVPEWHTWTVTSRYRKEVDGAAYPIVSRAIHSRAALDVLWFPWNGCSWTSFRKPAVATLHDASNFAIPGYAPQTQVIFRAAADRCAALITDSVFSQGELAHYLAIGQERLRPILLGVDPEPPAPPITEAIAAMQPYVLFVGQSERRKGIDSLLAAFARLHEDIPALRLVLAGSRGDAIEGDVPDGVYELGFVDDAVLAQLYAHAAVFAFPSRYEGFGLPVLEAMSYGTPVIAARTSALPEVADGAAAFVDPNDREALAHEIFRILHEPAYAHRLREHGRRRAHELTWERTAERTLEVLEDVAG
jgi:glycosyltransferase involved in cell wall biosynthesis